MKPARLGTPTVNIDVASTTARVSLGLGVTRSMRQLRVMNDGTATAWIEFGDSSVTAALVSSVPIGSGVTEVLTVTDGVTHVAAIAAGATGKIYFTPCDGI